MEAATTTTAHLTQVVPFLGVTDMERSPRFYLDGLGFTLKNKWEPEGRVRWCWLTRGAASLMVQGFVKQGDGIVMPKGKLGEGILLCFQCEDAVALYHEFRSRSIEAEEPFVGNSMWVTVLRDPDGYKLDVESPTNVPEDTTLSEFETSQNA
jgi:catechol 2,3-dioxygenase-like lactoylglutathione lyase family enzyme